MHLVWGDIVELLDLLLEVDGKIVFLLALAERVGDKKLLLFRISMFGNPFGIPAKLRTKIVLNERRTLKTVHYFIKED